MAGAGSTAGAARVLGPTLSSGELTASGAEELLPMAPASSAVTVLAFGGSKMRGRGRPNSGVSK